MALIPLALMLALSGGLLYHESNRASETVILLPDADGGVGRVAVNPGAGERVLDQAGQAARIGETVAVERLSAAEIAALRADTDAAQPTAPASYMLYFKEGTSDLAPGSEQALQDIFADLADRAAPEITIIGHTDRVGRLTANDALALKRAETVRVWLKEQGVTTDWMDVAGRGEREPLIQTKDGVAEPRNRRVEISIR